MTALRDPGMSGTQVVGSAPEAGPQTTTGFGYGVIRPNWRALAMVAARLFACNRR